MEVKLSTSTPLSMISNIANASYYPHANICRSSGTQAFTDVFSELVLIDSFELRLLFRSFSLTQPTH